MAREFTLGVLFVHGIGTQKWSDVLVRWGDVLIQTLHRATRGEVQVTVQRAASRLTPEDDRFAEVHLYLETSASSEKWLLSEAWWAESFPVPTYRELVSWSLRALPWAIALNIARSYWRMDARPRREALKLAAALGKLAILVPLAPVFVLLLAVVSVFGLVPPLRAWALAVQSTFTATMGDSLAFVESPLRAEFIRTCLKERLGDLVQRCDRTVVVAHSQGAAAIIDAMGGLAMRQGIHHSTDCPRPNALVTFGAAVNQVVSQRVIADDSFREKQGNKLAVTLGLAAIIGAVMGWVIWSIWLSPATIPEYMNALVILLRALVVAVIVYSFPVWLFRLMTVSRPQFAKHLKKAEVGFLLLAVTVASVMLWSVRNDLHTELVSSLVWLTIMFTASLFALLSLDIKKLVTEPVQPPPGLSEWTELYASADPVPSGPTLSSDPTMPKNHAVWNRGSVFSDHTTYWDNLDGFVLRVVRICATTAKSLWADALPQQQHAIDARTKWRVRALQWGRWSAVVVWIAVGASLFWGGRYGLIPSLPGIPRWVPQSAIKPGLLALLVILAAWIFVSLVSGIWTWWVRAEQEASLAQQPISGNGAVPLFLIASTVWAPLIGAALISESVAALPDSKDIFTFLGAVLVPSAISVWGMFRLFPPPIIPPASTRPVAESHQVV